MTTRAGSAPNQTSPPAPLHGRRILVLEDETLIALDVAATIEEAGGIAVTTHDAKAALEVFDAAEGRGGLDCAVLDVQLRGHTSEDVARRLRDAGVPFVFYTASLGHLGASDGTVARDAPVIGKPAPPETLLAAISDVIDG